jgi:hypothetical protein
MTTPSNTNGNVAGDDDRGNWSQLGEMIGGSINPTTTAAITSLRTANINANNATTTNGDTFPTAASSAWRPLVLAPTSPDSSQMSSMSPLNSGASLTVDSSSQKSNNDLVSQVGITPLSTSLSPCSLFVIIANLRLSLHCIEMAVNPQWWSRSSTGHRDFTFWENSSHHWWSRPSIGHRDFGFWENSSSHTEGTSSDDECLDSRIFEHGDGNR